MSIPPVLDQYQWPASNARIAEQVGLLEHQIIRFDGNVAPAPPASARPAVVARALADVNEYDRGRYESLRSDIARYHGLELNQVAIGAGSDEFIVLLAHMFASGGTVATVPAFSYSMYKYAALMAGATLTSDIGQADLVFVCRPNNPTGELPEIPDVKGQLVIDEAYADYAGINALDRIDSGAIILRTFSKAFGLAGARVGYALAQLDLIAAITSRQAPLSVSALSAALARQALANPPDLTNQLAERNRLAIALADLGLTPRPSYTNFLFVPHEQPHELVERLLPYGVVTRAYPGGWRVSVRDETDNDILLSVLRHELLGEPLPLPWTSIERTTAETLLRCRLRLRGEGRVLVDTGAGFYDHMLQQLAFNAGMDLRLEGRGDLETGDHHTVEDMMITFGQALDQALGNRQGLARYGEFRVPMDEALGHVVIDLSGRATANVKLSPDPGMAEHMFISLAQHARITIHVEATGTNAHHVAEASFKAAGRALGQAIAETGGGVASTKGSL